MESTDGGAEQVVHLRRAAGGAPLRTVGVVLVAGAVLFGLAFRAWLLTHAPLTSDEAIVGLMAGQIRHGHFYTFYWGQAYGGAEPYLVAGLSLLFGTSPLALNLTPVMLGAVSAVLVWRIGIRLVPPGRQWYAVAAACALWVWPEAGLYNSTRELGFRGVTVAAGLACVLFALRVVDRRSLVDACWFGLFLGVTWWSSPEAVYFAVPVVCLLGLIGGSRIGWLSRPSRRVWEGLALAGAGAVVGSLPWIWTNFHTSFASLERRSAHMQVHASYGGRLHVFFTHTFPMMLGLRVLVTGAWVGGAAGKVLFLVAVTGIALLVVRGLAVLWRPDETSSPAAAAALAMLAFPFVYAEFPPTGYWQEGIYGTALIPLVLIMILASSRLPFRWSLPSLDGPRNATRAPRTRWSYGPKVRVGVAALAAMALVASTVLSFHSDWPQLPRNMLADSKDPNQSARMSVQELKAAGITYGYAQYWVAYKLDYLSGGKLTVSDVTEDRPVKLYRSVRAAPSQAWIFYTPSSVTLAESQFGGSLLGPGGYSEKVFLRLLVLLHIPYRIDHAGLLDAVRPARIITQEQLRLPPPLWR